MTFGINTYFHCYFHEIPHGLYSIDNYKFKGFNLTHSVTKSYPMPEFLRLLGNDASICGALARALLPLHNLTTWKEYFLSDFN